MSSVFRNHPRSSKGGRPNPASYFVRSGGIFAILCLCAMLRSCWRSAVSMSITQPFGAGCSITVPSLEPRLRRHRKPTNKSWRVDETYVRVKGRWCYLYRAIDSKGATIDFLLSAFRDADAAKRLFRKALGGRSHPQPRVINTDLAPIYGSAIPDSKKEGTLRKRCRHRPVQYLNNILEQDHRAIKRRVNAKQGFREFQAARRTIQGYEAVHMIRKGQVRWVAGDNLLRQIQFIDSLFDLAT